MRLALMIAGAVVLAACNRPSPVADEAENASSLPETKESSPSPTGGAPTAAPPSASGVTAGASRIPAELHGRWGLTPGDCSAPLGNAKGLLVIENNELRFYESSAAPAANVQTSANSISGDFAFTGEGQSWTRHETLEIRDGQLVRTEREPVASFRYVRC